MKIHNLGFGSKIRKIGILLYTPVLPYKVGFNGVYPLHGHFLCEKKFYDDEIRAQ